jgi:hypothetical protein
MTDPGLVREPDLDIAGADAVGLRDLLHRRGQAYGMARPSTRERRLQGSHPDRRGTLSQTAQSQKPEPSCRRAGAIRF